MDDGTQNQSSAGAALAAFLVFVAVVAALGPMYAHAIGVVAHWSWNVVG